MGEEFVSRNEYDARVADGMDYLRTETARHLRKYARRIKKDGEAAFKELISADPNFDPEEVAERALKQASRGMLGRRMVELDAGPFAES